MQYQNNLQIAQQQGNQLCQTVTTGNCWPYQQQGWQQQYQPEIRYVYVSTSPSYTGPEITKVENGFVVKHAGKTYVATTFERLCKELEKLLVTE